MTRKGLVTARAAWADRIGRAWAVGASHMISAILKTGDLLVEAKIKLEHGEFAAMTETDLPFGSRAARMFMAIAVDVRIRELVKRNHGSVLPPYWRTLYELTRLDDADFRAFSKQLTVTTDRNEIADFLRQRARGGYSARTAGGGTLRDLQALAASGFRAGAIYTDPPWTFEVYSGKGKQRSAERHYDTMTLDDICALPVGDLAADDCALFLWGVWPELPGALRVIEAWGFEYKTAAFVWVKQNRKGDGLFTGMGYWTRANTEPCFFATRGSPTRQALDVPQVILAPVGEHSQKPAEARSRIERLVNGPYLELFGRDAVDGWTTWGNEIAIQKAAE